MMLYNINLAFERIMSKQRGKPQRVYWLGLERDYSLIYNELVINYHKLEEVIKTFSIPIAFDNLDSWSKADFNVSKVVESSLLCLSLDIRNLSVERIQQLVVVLEGLPKDSPNDGISHSAMAYFSERAQTAASTILEHIDLSGVKVPYIRKGEVISLRVLAGLAVIYTAQKIRLQA